MCVCGGGGWELHGRLGPGGGGLVGYLLCLASCAHFVRRMRCMSYLCCVSLEDYASWLVFVGMESWVVGWR